jgi:hypothetical protein
VDETLIAANLALSPAERLARFSAWQRNVGELARVARASSAGAG